MWAARPKKDDGRGRLSTSAAYRRAFTPDRLNTGMPKRQTYIPGKHDDAYAVGNQRFERGWRRCFDWVGYSDHARQLAFNGDEYRRRSIATQAFGFVL